MTSKLSPKPRGARKPETVLEDELEGLWMFVERTCRDDPGMRLQVFFELGILLTRERSLPSKRAGR